MAAFSDAVGIYNVCTNTNISVNDLFEKIKGLLNVDIKPVYKSERKGDIRHSYMSYEKIKKDIGWEPKIGFDEGLERTLEYYKTKCFDNFLK